MAEYDAQGREIPDPTPVSVPGGFVRPLSIQEEIRRAIRGELSRQAAEDGMETFEESDDFEVDEDPDPLSVYEIPEGVPERAPGPVESLDGTPTAPNQEKLNLEAPDASQGHSGNSGSPPVPNPAPSSDNKKV